tara:strand:+ start:324 stop:2006 length:1683 start_codon:yes stop_codon:yes gene_type:complete
MIISKGILKQMIAEEMAKFNTMSEQEEEQGQDEAGEAQPSAGGIDANKALDMNLPQFVQALQSNQEDVIKAVLGGLTDGGADDDKVNIVPTTVPIADLKPTQSEVVFSKSIPFALENPEVFMKYLSGNGPFKVGPPGNDAIITLNGQFILDGHHRWSSLYSINPDASMHTFDIQVPGLEPLDALKLMQASIKAHSGAVPSNKGGGVNLFQIDTDNLTKGVKNSATPENLRKLINLGFLKGAQAVDEQEGNQLQQALRKLLKLYGANIARMRANNAPVSGASSREPMPQTDKPSGSQVTAGGDTPAALEPLEKGQIDFKKPFAEGDKKGEQKMQESKKDLLKRIVAEEVAKMEIDAVQKEGIFDFFKKKKKEEPAPEPEPEAPSEEELKAQAIQKIKDDIFLPMGFNATVRYFNKYGFGGGHMLRGAFVGNKMKFGHYAADYVADELAGKDGKKSKLAYLADEDLELALATAIYNQNPKAVNDKKRNQEIVNTMAAAAEAQYEYMTKDTGGGGSSSSSRKSEFDKWQSGEGDNYNYMTRMENLSKEQLAKIVKEELAQLKK